VNKGWQQDSFKRFKLLIGPLLTTKKVVQIIKRKTKKKHMKRKKIIQFSSLALFLVVWGTIIFLFGTEKIVQLIGTKNSYIILFVVGAAGGVSTVTATSFYSTLTTFANGGLNPITLGLIGGTAITIGDSLFYYLGKKGEESLPNKAQKITKRISKWIDSYPKCLIPIITFVYSGLTPLPNDILTVSLGVSRYKYRYVIAPLLLGNIFLTTVIAIIASGMIF